MKITIQGRTYEDWEIYEILESVTQGAIMVYTWNNRMYGPLVLQVLIFGAQLFAMYRIKKEMEAKRW